MAKAFIASVRSCDFVLFQYIDLDTDAVTFCEDLSPDKQVDIFTMESDCTTYCLTTKGDKLLLGKFKYIDKINYKQNINTQVISFEFDIKFLEKHKNVTMLDVTFATNDFLKAECRLVELLLSMYPTIFMLSNKQ